MTNLRIDPEFRDKIPPLTDAEFEQLQENILNDGEVYEPIAVWNGTIDLTNANCNLKSRYLDGNGSIGKAEC